ncbi:Retrovirus-related Pol polyprotein from transposon RE2 [Bienertia sinuspersici]
MSGQFCMISCNKQPWLLDSGATDHICCDLNSFSSYFPCSKPYHSIMIPNGKRVFITHKVSVVLNDDIQIDNVLFVPEFKFNLISVHKLCQEMKCQLLFTSDKCFLQHHQGTTIQLGNLDASLYAVGSQSLVSKPAAAQSTCNKSCFSSVSNLQLWHVRLGHLPFSMLKLVAPDCLVRADTQNFICQVCPVAKQTRCSFPRSSIKSHVPFELLHLDIWGPNAIKTYNGYTIFLTIVDDFTRFTWVHLLKFKSDAVSIMQDFLIW